MVTRRTPAHRVERILDVELHDIGATHPLISTLSHTVNISLSGLLMEVPSKLDACVGQDVIVTLKWPGGVFESEGQIVRFESPYWKDGESSVMGVRLDHPLPEGIVMGEDLPH